MACQQNTFEQLLSEFIAERFREETLLTRLTTLLDQPASKSAVPKRIATIYAQAKLAWGSDALRFLTRPHQLLECEIPLYVAAQDEAGARRVEQLLGRIIGGAYA